MAWVRPEIVSGVTRLTKGLMDTVLNGVSEAHTGVAEAKADAASARSSASAANTEMSTGRLSEATLNATYAPKGAVGASNLPVLTVTTENAAPIASKTTYVYCTYALDGVAGTGRIRGRGNSTWSLGAKKPYKVKLDNAIGFGGLPASKDFALLANFFDPSLIRNSIYFNLGARCTGLPFTPKLVSVDLVVNGEYRGVYQLAQTVQIDADRVAEPEASGTSGLESTGAYLMEIDARYASDGNPGFTTTKGVPIAYDAPDGTVPEQAAYIRQWVQTFEDTLYGSSWLDPVNGYAKYIDMDSFADWWLVNELVANQDSGFNSSCKLYKSRDTADTPGRLHMGPLWDGDQSIGIQWSDISTTPYTGPSRPATGWWTKLGAKWIDRMLADPAFVATVRSHWAALYASITAPTTGITATVDRMTAEIASSRQRDQTVWTGTAAYQAGTDWRAEATFIKTWLTTRIDWLNTQIAALGTPPASTAALPFVLPVTL